MDFHQLVARMQELDRPVAEVQTQECGEPMNMPTPMSPPPMSSQPPVPPPSLSVNLSAHGMSDIEHIMRLCGKLNPETIPQAPMPSMAPMASITSIKPSLPPLKMLPDFDADNDNMPGGEMDNDDGVTIPLSMKGDDADDSDDKDMLPEPIDRDGEEDGELDNDKEKEEIGGALAGGAIGALAGGPLGALTGAAAGDSLTDPDADEVEQEEQEEAYANEPDEKEASIDYMNNKLAGGMNRPKNTFPKVAGGDNPMQKVKEGSDLLRLQIRAELQKRLAEAKGAR
jgi:hypothetical protein